MSLITNRLSFIVGTIFFIIILCLNIFAPESRDDYPYKYQFVNGGADTNYAIEKVSDIFISQIEHYKVFNGRVIVHGVVQLFTGMLGKGVFNVINTMVLILLSYLLVKVFMCGFTVYKFILVNLLLLLLMPSFNDCFLWLTGSINYLWVSTAVVLYLYVLSKLQNKKLVTKYWIYGMFSIILGWTHEGIVFPLALSSLFCYLFIFTYTPASSRK